MRQVRDQILAKSNSDTGQLGSEISAATRIPNLIFRQDLVTHLPHLRAVGRTLRPSRPRRRSGQRHDPEGLSAERSSSLERT